MEKSFEIIIIVMLLAIMAEIYVLTGKKRRSSKSGDGETILIDTSVLMDGRVVEVAKTGFLMGQVVVPRTVLGELQLLADGSDHDKRERARFGMDVVRRLQDIYGGSFTLLQDDRQIPEGVDMRLLALAKEMNASVMTLDYNLNKVAQVEGVNILNINELAKSLRMSHLPGDAIDLSLTQKGQDSHQGVGYLSDGTMVVVEQGKKHIGQTKRVEIIRSLQTDAGKMMFGKIVDVKDLPAQKTTGTKSLKRPTRRTIAGREASAKNNKTSGNSAKRSNDRRRTSTVGRNTRQKTSAQREAELIKLVENQRD